MMIVMRSETAPDDQPWLLSSRGDLAEANELKEVEKARWSAALGPEEGATLASKKAWMERFKYSFMDKESELSRFQQEKCPEFDDVLPEIMLASCRPQVSIQLLMTRSAVKAHADAKPKSDKPFSAAPGGLTLRFPGKAKPKSLAAWWKALSSAKDPGTTVPFDTTHHKDSYVLVATLAPVPCGTEISGLLSSDKAGALGALESLVGIGINAKTLRPTEYEFSIGDKAGECVHYPGTVDGVSVVPFELLCGPCSAQKAAAAADGDDGDGDDGDDVEGEKEPGDTNEFWAAVEAKQALQRTAGPLGAPCPTPKMAVVTPPYSLQAVFWADQAFYTAEKARIKAHEGGAGEAPHIKKRLSRGNTDSGNLRIGLFEREYHCIKGSRGYGEPRKLTKPQQLLGTLALVNTMVFSWPWMHDNEEPAAVRKLYADIATYLRTKLLKLTDDELAIGPSPGLEDIAGTNRTALYHFLEFHKKKLATEGPEGEAIKFNFRPGKPKSEAWKAAQRESHKKRKIVDTLMNAVLGTQPGGKKYKSTDSLTPAELQVLHAAIQSAKAANNV